MSLKIRTYLLAASMLAGTGAAATAAPLVTEAVNDAVTTAVTGEVSSRLAVASDLGALSPTRTLQHVRMVLKRPADRQAALDKLVSDQQNPKSPSYRKWLTPSDLRGYGPDQADIDATVAWLGSHGLTVNSVAASGMSIDFGGPVSAIASAFHTSLHSVSFAGETHIANMTDLAIPAALAPVVRGATLSNFFPKPNMVRPNPAFTLPTNPTFYAVGPADFATIYNVAPALSGANFFGAPITGAGVTIEVVEQTEISPADWKAFRNQFALSGYSGTLSIIHPANCGNPGFTGDEGEAALDAEWSSAVAPDADIIEASCPAGETGFGVETTLQNIVENGTKASVLSISYGGAEAANGLSFLAGWNDLVEMGAAEGLSIMISTGDGGVSADTGVITKNGIAVNGLSTNAYNTSLGGTDFYDTALGQNATYWNASNKHGLASAKSYVPEIPWDNSCASSIISKYLGFGSDALASCNSTATHTGLPFVQNDVGGTGGQSILFSKPDWQTGVLGIPNDGVRDQPDVSLFASNGSWAHFYVYCMSNPNTGGTPCKYNNPNDVLGNAAGGTSFAAPAFAGVMALVTEVRGQRVGNASPRLYQLAGLQYSNSLLLGKCNATLGNKISTACVFNDITAGNNAEPCVKGSVDCHGGAAATQGIGVLRSPNFPSVDAFPAQPGYSLATGLGSVNVLNLLYNF